MTVLVYDTAIDTLLQHFKDTITEMYVCSGDPATRAAAITASLATKTGLTGTDFSALADGDTNGRKVTKLAETAIAIIATGTAAVVCFSSATTLVWKVNISPTQGLTSGGIVDTSAVDHEVADAT